MKKKIEEINQRLKPLQDQVKKTKTDFEKCHTNYKAKVKSLRIRSTKVKIVVSFQYKENLEMKNKIMKEITALSEQSDDLIEKIRDDLRHKREEEKRRLESCAELEGQIAELEEQFHSIELSVNESESLQVG